MNTSQWQQRLIPQFKFLSIKERLLSGIGASLGLALSSLISWYVLDGINAWYIAPMGASAVLLFAVWTSPLARPWNICVGNSIAAFVGVACALWIENLSLAFSVAVGLSIILMMSTDSVHPPSGAIAMTAVLGGDAVNDLGYAFVVYPVLINSVLILLVAIIFNRLIGRSYPQAAGLNQRSRDPTPTQRVGISPEDIEYALDQQTTLLDISQYDLETIIQTAQQHANQYVDLGAQCIDIMSKDVVYINEKDLVSDALKQFKIMNIMSLPVIDQQHYLVGTLALSDVIEQFEKAENTAELLQSFVYKVMHKQVVKVKPEQPIADLIPYFVEKSFNYLPVTEGNGRLIGMISRADVIAVLYQNIRHRDSSG